MHAVLAGVLISALIVPIVLLVRHGRIRYLKQARINAEGTEVAEYEEVGPKSVVVPHPGFSVDMNVCYSLKQGAHDPVYAEIEEAIDTKRNDAYGTRSLQISRPTASSSPHRPL